MCWSDSSVVDLAVFIVVCLCKEKVVSCVLLLRIGTSIDVPNILVCWNIHFLSCCLRWVKFRPNDCLVFDYNSPAVASAFTCYVLFVQLHYQVAPIRVCFYINLCCVYSLHAIRIYNLSLCTHTYTQDVLPVIQVFKD